MINVGDGRGQERSALAQKNKEAIIDFFKRNPGATKLQCANSLGISPITVTRHIKLINGN